MSLVNNNIPPTHPTLLVPPVPHPVPHVKASKYVKNESGLYVCPRSPCTELHESQSAMYYHIQTAHDKILKYECKYCIKKFPQKCSLERHQANNHSKEILSTGNKDANRYIGLKFKCPDTECTETKSTKGNLQIHYVRKHCSKIPAFTNKSNCTECKKELSSNSAYLYHVATSSSCFKNVLSTSQMNSILSIK